MQGIRGKNVLVTGGSSGIGQAIAIRFAEEGANVAINYRSGAAEAERTHEIIHANLDQMMQHGGKHILVQADVSKEDAIVGMFEKVSSELGSLDILINNAGFQIAGASHEIPIESFDRVIATFAPSSAKRMAMAWPMPELPPVTRTFFPRIPCMMSSFHTITC